MVHPHEGSGCSCAHQEEAVSGGITLLPYIDKEAISALNQYKNTIQSLFRPFDQRFEDISCRSDDDSTELIIHVPFLSPCKLTSLRMIGGAHGTHPKDLHLYTNIDGGLDFDSIADLKETDRITLNPHIFCGTADYPVRPAKFNNVYSLDIYINESVGGDYVELHWIGIHGIPSKAERRPVVTVYESRPNLADHQIKDLNAPNFTLG